MAVKFAIPPFYKIIYRAKTAKFSKKLGVEKSEIFIFSSDASPDGDASAKADPCGQRKAGGLRTGKIGSSEK